jgi:NADH-quinone oxidoreductase subunit L
MICRAFYGKQSPEATELQHGHIHHPEHPTNPANGEIEDIEVGFPGPDHHIAERTATMRGAMFTLAVLSIIGGFLQIPGVTDVIDDFLAPAFPNSKYYGHLEPSATLEAVGMTLGAVLAIVGIAIAFRIWVGKPGISTRLRERFAGAYTLFSNKWWFDEGISFLFVRPFAWLGRFARGTFERVVVDGFFVGGTSFVVRAGSAAVRASQTGLMRYYAGVLLVGLIGIGLYFLIAS